MQRSNVFLMLMMLAACESVPSSGTLLQPIPSVSSTPESKDSAKSPKTPAAQISPAAAASTTVPADPLTPTKTPSLRGSLLDDGSPKPVIEPAPSPAPSEATPLSPPHVLPVDPSAKQATMSTEPAPPQWGIRLVATLPTAQPPRAILALPQGQEIVVTPGDMLPDQHLVVMAVGSSSVQVALLHPEGDHVRIESKTLSAQYAPHATPIIHPQNISVHPSPMP